MTTNSRRSLLKGAAAIAGASALGLPMIARAQSDKIRLGHLTPLTGFLQKADYESVVPLFANLNLLLVFKKTVAID